MRLHARVDLREGADRAGNGAGGDFLARRMQAAPGAGEFGVGVSELEPEGGRLGMDAVRAADGRRQFVLERAALERGEQRIHVGDENVGGAHQLHVEAGVEHVGGGHAGMHEARFRPDDLRQMRQEGDDVVFDLRFDRVDAGDVELGGLAFFPDFLRRFFRNDAELGHGLGGVSLDFEPDAEFRFRRPDRHHVGAGIAVNRHAASPRASAAALRIAAMLPL